MKDKILQNRNRENEERDDMESPTSDTDYLPCLQEFITERGGRNASQTITSTTEIEHSLVIWEHLFPHLIHNVLQ